MTVNFPGTAPADLDKSLMQATIDLIGRAGAKSFRMGWVEEEDLPAYPHIWYATAAFKGAHEAAAAMDPVTACTRLAEQLVDGGTCTHCGRPTALHVGPRDLPVEVATDKGVAAAFTQTGAHICWYYYDPSTKAFKRGCE